MESLVYMDGIVILMDEESKLLGLKQDLRIYVSWTFSIVSLSAKLSSQYAFL